MQEVESCDHFTTSDPETSWWRAENDTFDGIQRRHKNLLSASEQGSRHHATKRRRFLAVLDERDALLRRRLKADRLTVKYLPAL
jgi:hypothetical protein